MATLKSDENQEYCCDNCGTPEKYYVMSQCPNCGYIGPKVLKNKR